MERASTIAGPPTWAPDPWHPAQVRWWDGERWTGEVRPLYAPPAPGADPALRWVLPVGRSGLAVAAGYLGLFSLLLLPAPAALVVGWLALKDLDAHPERLGRGRALVGIVLGGLGTGFLVVLLVAAALGA